jgi:N-acetylmuramoyl-L-alanine amidase
LRFIFRISWIAVCLVLLSSAFAFAGADIGLTLDSQPVQTEAAPVIVEGRTLVPVRALFEAMGGDVGWDAKTGKVTVLYGDTTVVMTVGSKTARVNGTDQTMDVAARILPSGRTYIPVRFAASALGFGVDWDDNQRVVIITSPGYIKEEPTVITNISATRTDTDYRVVVRFTGAVPSLKSTAFADPDRYVTDFWSAAVHIGAWAGGSGTVAADNPIFSAVRYSQFKEDTVRIVCDLNEKVAGKISVDEEAGELYIDFDDPKAQDGSGENPGTEDPQSPEDPPEDNPDSDLPDLDWRMSGKLVLIDAGHGGADPGCLVQYNGKTYYEKDFNLEIALQLVDMLKQAGVHAGLLRSTDETVKLLERPAIANGMMADLYVSIHNNSRPPPRQAAPKYSISINPAKAATTLQAKSWPWRYHGASWPN